MTGADLLIQGGSLLDGTGADPISADVVIRDGLIQSILDGNPPAAKRVIDASGLTIAPGFVDIHSHADMILLAERETREALLAARLSQGITTIVVGNCGVGPGPCSDDVRPVLSDLNGWMTPPGVDTPALSIDGYLSTLESNGVPLNVGTLIPHGPVRLSAMGLRAGPPSTDELAVMKRLVVEGLGQGAYGLSTGLIYPPGMYSATSELIALARIVAEHDAIFTSHIRGSSETLLAATAELIEIARESGARAHHSHLEAVGERFWRDIEGALALEDQARQDGLQISHDVFLYTRAATMMLAVFPPWALEGGLPALLERLDDPATRARIQDEIEHHVPEWPPWQKGGWPHNLVGAVGWEGIRVASLGADGPSETTGKSLVQLGKERECEPFDVLVDLMRAHAGQVGQFVDQISGRDEQLEGLLTILSHPLSAVITDAEDYGTGAPHPAHAGGFARALRINRRHSLFPLPELIRRMTSYPASIIGLDRGVLRPGAPADLVLFDPATVSDRADYEQPRLTPTGMPWVILNGQVVVDNGVAQGGLHGTVLRAS